MRHANRWALCMLIATFVLAALSLFPGQAPPSGVREREAILAAQAAHSLAGGELLPRWAPDLGGGHGSPWFLFHAPLAYLLPAGGILLGVPAAPAVLLALWTTLAVATWLAFLLGRELWGPMAGALLAPLYVLSPWHLSSLQQLAGSLALGLPPLALWALLCYSRRQQRGYAVVATLALAALPLSDLPAAGVLGPALAVSFLVLALRRRISGLDLAVVCLGAASLSAFFWLPAWWESKHLLARRTFPGGGVAEALQSAWQHAWFDPGLVLGAGLALTATFLVRRRLQGAGRWLLPAVALLLAAAAYSGATPAAPRGPAPDWDVPATFRPQGVRTLPAARRAARFPAPPGCRLDQQRRQATLYFFDAVCDRATVMETHLFHYPGWTVHVDNQRQQANRDPQYGTLRIALAAGAQRVKVSFGHTPLRRNTRFLSLATLVVLAAWWLSRRNSRDKPA